LVAFEPGSFCADSFDHRVHLLGCPAVWVGALHPGAHFVVGDYVADDLVLAFQYAPSSA